MEMADRHALLGLPGGLTCPVGKQGRAPGGRRSFPSGVGPTGSCVLSPPEPAASRFPGTVTRTSQMRELSPRGGAADGPRPAQSQGEPASLPARSSPCRGPPRGSPGDGAVTGGLAPLVGLSQTRAIPRVTLCHPRVVIFYQTVTQRGAPGPFHEEGGGLSLAEAGAGPG